MRLNGGIIGQKLQNSSATASGIWNTKKNFVEQNAKTFPSMEVVKTNLQLHLDAGNSNSYPGSGTSWFDISGNARHFSWNSVNFTSGANPYFSTSGRRCTGPASNSFGITNTSGYTIYLIMYQNSANNSAAFKFYGSVGNNRAITAHCSWSDGNIYFDQGGCCDADTRLSVSGGTMNTWNIFVFRRATTTRQLFKNNSLLQSNTTVAANPGFNTTAVDLGGSDEYGGASSSWDARLSQFIVYNRALTTTEMNTNYAALKTRYGL